MSLDTMSHVTYEAMAKAVDAGILPYFTSK